MRKTAKRPGGYSRCLALCLSAALIALLGGGCANSSVKKVKLDPDNPVTISVWHYYNGMILNAFNSMVQEFNETVGMEKGIIVEGYGLGNVSELEKEVLAAAKKEVGSMEMPDVFASYADTAYKAEEMGMLANLDDYFAKEEQQQYLDSYIEEGKIGLNGELRIFPIAKSTELMMLNDTDWQPFAQECQFTYEDLATLEGLVRVSQKYYEWTDARTPDVPNDGKAFYGRDSVANMFIIGAKELGTEIFKVTSGKCELQINRDDMKKLWDYYYVPFIKGYFTAKGRYRSDDAKVGDLLAYVGSTSSSTYFPQEVTINDQSYPVVAMVLPAPHFENGTKTIVQQGAGMVVSKSVPENEYASIEFLKWFTDVENNTLFAAMSGYMPVKKEASNYDVFIANLKNRNQTVDEITDRTLKIAFESISNSAPYTNKAFSGGADARSILEKHLPEKAVADRAAVVTLLQGGTTLEEATAPFVTEEAFDAWLADFTSALQTAINPAA